MSNRQYVCNLWPELVIGAKVKFRGGFFETDDEQLQQLVESRDAFGTSIHYKDTIEAMEAAGRHASEEKANKKARDRQELLDALAELEKDEGKEAAKEEARLRQEAEDAEAAKLLKAADKVVGANGSDTDQVNGPGPDAPIAGQSQFGGFADALPGQQADAATQAVVGNPAEGVGPKPETAAERKKREKAEADAKKAADAAPGNAPSDQHQD